MKFSTLIFDLGNVTLTNDYPFHTPEEIAQFCKYFDITFENAMKGWETAWPQFRIGKVTEDNFWKKFLQSAGARVIDRGYAKKFWRDHQRPIENMLSLLYKLRQKYMLASLTTISKEWLVYKRKKFHLDTLFPIIVSSGQYGVVKPDPKIYNILLQRINVAPSACLFIDDMEYAIPPAKALGIKTVLFKGQKDLENNLKKYRVLS